MYFIEVTDGKSENLKKEGKLSMDILIFINITHFPYLKVYTEHWLQKRLRNLGQKFPWLKNKNKQIKGLISSIWLFL